MIGSGSDVGERPTRSLSRSSRRAIIRVEATMKRRHLLVGPATLLLVLLLGFSARPAAAAQPVSIIEMDGAISPITVRLLAAALERARADGSQALVVELNTPGGLERSMRSAVQSILSSEIPVIVYVAPTCPPWPPPPISGPPIPSPSGAGRTRRWSRRSRTTRPPSHGPSPPTGAETSSGRRRRCAPPCPRQSARP